MSRLLRRTEVQAGGASFVRRHNFEFVFSCLGGPPFRFSFLKGWVFLRLFFLVAVQGDEVQATFFRNVASDFSASEQPILSCRKGRAPSSLHRTVNYESDPLFLCLHVKQNFSENRVSHPPDSVATINALLSKAFSQPNSVRVFWL
jgi:hypothetical protein